jgi:hypothetical protein
MLGVSRLTYALVLCARPSEAFATKLHISTVRSSEGFHRPSPRRNQEMELGIP